MLVLNVEMYLNGLPNATVALSTYGVTAASTRVSEYIADGVWNIMIAASPDTASTDQPTFSGAVSRSLGHLFWHFLIELYSDKIL